MAFLRASRNTSSPLDETGRRDLTRISGSAKQMGALIDDLLAFSRIGRAEFRRTRVDLAGLCWKVLGILEPDTAGRDIAWEIDDLPKVR